jgi:hypothetical protein
VKLFKIETVVDLDSVSIVAQIILDHGGQIINIGTVVMDGNTRCWNIFHTVEDETVYTAICNALGMSHEVIVIGR